MFDKMKLFMSGLWAFIRPFFMKFISEAGSFALTTAMEVVLTIAKDPSLLSKSGTEKRDIALQQIRAKAIGAGIQLSTTMILDAIQAAYNRLSDEGKI